MSRPRRIGVSYRRFSDPHKQKHSDSENRQDHAYHTFCERHNLIPQTEVFMDRGKSGFKDEHRKKGRLGVLIAHAKAGRFDRGTVLVVEAWDRLGRLIPNEQIKLIEELLKTGVDIGVCQLDDVFTLADFGTYKWHMLSAFILLAYQESKQKSERVTASHQTRRKLASAGRAMPPRRDDGRVSRLITDRLPCWLEPHGDWCRPVPEREAAIRRVFALAREGKGHVRIINALTADGVTPFGPAGKWNRPLIKRILTDRRVLGEFRPAKGGEAIPDYYPRIIDDEEWQLTRASLEGRRGTDRKGRALVRSERKYVNTFRGLLVCATDGEGFMLANTGRPGAPLLLVNSASDAGRAPMVTFPFLIFEEALLRKLKEVKAKDVLPPAGAGASPADVLRARLGNIRKDIAELKEIMNTRGVSATLAEMVYQKEAEATAVDGELREEEARSARPAEAAWNEFPTLVDMVKKDGDDARLRLRPVLRSMIDEARVLIVKRGSWQYVAVQVFFRPHGTRAYLIARQSAAGNRPERWEVDSGASHRPGWPALDLRKPECVEWLKGELPGCFTP